MLLLHHPLTAHPHESVDKHSASPTALARSSMKYNMSHEHVLKSNII